MTGPAEPSARGSLDYITARGPELDTYPAGPPLSLASGRSRTQVW